jgi:flagellar biosynthesis GTPase FlhF
MVDVRSIWRMVANSESHADRFVTQHFPDIGPGTKRIQWQGETKKGTVVVRADLVATKLRWFRRGKCQVSLAVADELNKMFPKADLVSVIGGQLLDIEEVDTSDGVSFPIVSSMAATPAQRQIGMMQGIEKLVLSQMSDETYNEIEDSSRKAVLAESRLRSSTADALSRLVVIKEEEEKKQLKQETEEKAKRTKQETEESAKRSKQETEERAKQAKQETEERAKQAKQETEERAKQLAHETKTKAVYANIKIAQELGDQEMVDRLKRKLEEF